MTKVGRSGSANQLRFAVGGHHDANGLAKVPVGMRRAGLNRVTGRTYGPTFRADRPRASQVVWATGTEVDAKAVTAVTRINGQYVYAAELGRTARRISWFVARQRGVSLGTVVGNEHSCKPD
jgi:hypothetical protein